MPGSPCSAPSWRRRSSGDQRDDEATASLVRSPDSPSMSVDRTDGDGGCSAASFRSACSARSAHAIAIARSTERCADRSSLSKAVDTRRHDPGTTLPSYTSPAFPGVFERTWQVPAGRGVSRHFKCGIPRRPVDLRSLVRSRTCPSALRKPPRRLCPGSNLGSVAECT